jgi:hypothetical protein
MSYATACCGSFPYLWCVSCRILLSLIIINSLFNDAFQYLRLYSVDVGGKPAASAQFLLNPDSSARARAI